MIDYKSFKHRNSANSLQRKSAASNYVFSLSTPKFCVLWSTLTVILTMKATTVFTVLKSFPSRQLTKQLIKRFCQHSYIFISDIFYKAIPDELINLTHPLYQHMHGSRVSRSF